MSTFKSYGLALAATATMVFAATGHAAVTTYIQDFNALDASDPFVLGAIGGEGFLVYADVWLDFPGGKYTYSYGPLMAPNNSGSFVGLESGEGDGQYLSVYSDYSNADHSQTEDGVYLAINTAVIMQYTIEATDINGAPLLFSFDAKAPLVGGAGANYDLGIADPSSYATAQAGLVTLDPSAGYATTNDIRFDMTHVSDTEWTHYETTITLDDPALVGQLLQFTFNTTARGGESSAIFYDNVVFAATVPAPAAVWLFGSGLLGLVGIVRRRMA